MIYFVLFFWCAYEVYSVQKITTMSYIYYQLLSYSVMGYCYTAYRYLQWWMLWLPHTINWATNYCITLTTSAINVYRSEMIFPDVGEHCFCHEYSRRNLQKMVWLWTEKEMRNLKQLVSAGIHCPEPVKARFHWWIFYPSMIGYHHTWKILKLPHPHIQPNIKNSSSMPARCLINANSSAPI